MTARVRRAGAAASRAHFDRLAGHPLVGEVRGARADGRRSSSRRTSRRRASPQPGKVGARLAQELTDRGVIARAIADTLAFCPPMTITEGEIDEMFAPVEAALDATEAWAKAEGHLG